MPVSPCTAMSHSSRAQPSCSHQPPEDRHGPAAQRISPCISLFVGQVMHAGLSCCIVTATLTGGREIRRAVTRSSELFSSMLEPALRVVEACLRGETPSLGAKRCMRNPSGRCVSSNSNDPTLSSPTMLAILANVSSSFSGSGVGGRKSPFCVARRPYRFCRQLNLDDGSARRMSLQIKLQQFEKRLRVKQ